MTVISSPVAGPDGQLFGDLAAGGSRTAVTDGRTSLTWTELAARVEERAGQWRGSRRLVMLIGRNSIDFVVSYLAAISAECPVLVVNGCAQDVLTAAWDPDIVVDADTDRVDVRRATSAHELHPDLALLLSTSGSTGSPKLVRLSRENLLSNAASIVEYLGLTSDDCGMTSLPLHYCYGLSILHSHLLAGARLAVTERSVVDDGFWDLAEQARVTGLAGVPHTFDLWERTGFAQRDLPHLRYLTQAGGRLEADQVRAWHDLGVRRGWDLFVMYGQTEATARMAWLPPDLAAQHPGSIGRAVPGGALHLEHVEGADDGVGELVYTGANVMMGYAEHADDLALPPMDPVLRTGDLARELEGGLFEVVGRLKRITKVFGLRINLDDVEKHLATAGVPARVVGTDSAVVAFVADPQHEGRVREQLAASCGLPLWVVHVETLRELPLTGNGKPDYAAMSVLARDRTPRATRERPAMVDPEDVRQLFARVLNRPDASLDDTFVGLGADSLSYVEMSVRLSERIDPLPEDWHTRSIAALAEGGQRRRRGRSLDVTVVLRALAIVAVVGSHSEAWVLLGGAHLLLGLAGYNFVRFHLATGGAEPWRRIGWAVTAVVVPAGLWMGGVAVVTGEYTWRTVVFLNWTRQATSWDDQWRFWFLEALIWVLLGLAVLLSVRRVRDVEARHPFAAACAVLAGTLALRWTLSGVTAEDEQKYALVNVLWVFALGWLLARSSTRWQRLLSSAAVVLSVTGFFADVQRETLIIVGLLAVLWMPSVRVPRLAATVVGTVSAASLAIYVTQWQVYPHLEADHPYLAVVASIAVGVAYHRLTTPVVGRLRAVLSRPCPP